MSAEGDVAAVVEVATTETLPTTTSTISIEDALREVLRRSLIHDGLARGLREAIKALDRRQAHLCVLAESCEEKEYVRLVEALCAENGINLIKVPEAKRLGEWIGLCKYDKKGEAHKVVACACVVVRDYGEESEHLNVLLNYFKSR